MKIRKMLEKLTRLCATALAVSSTVRGMSRKAWVWTQELRTKVQASVQPGLSAQAIADMHGIDRRTVENAYQRGVLIPERQRKSWKRPTLEVIELVDRDCLSCGQAFKAEGRFVRRCHGCQGKTAHARLGAAPARLLAAV